MSPTAHPFVELIKYTERNVLEVTLVCFIQLVPSYFKIVPEAPTAQPELALNKCTPNKSSENGDETDQVEPL